MEHTYSSSAARRVIWTLFITQSLSSAALVANSTITPIVGAELSGQDALAGLPGALLLLGAASAAQPAACLMQRLGRRCGLALGFCAGVAGMVTGGIAIVVHLFPLFLLGLLLIGGARGAFDQSRYAAADAQVPEKRVRAISTIVFASAIGAIAGPALVGPSGNLLARFGVTPLAGPMWSGALLFALAGLLIAVLLRPSTDRNGAGDAASHPEPSRDGWRARSLSVTMLPPGAQLALAAMVTGQVVMVLIMSMTSLHMSHHHHGLDAVGMVIMVHTLGMYGLSVLTGPLAGRIGHRAAIATGALLLIVGSLLAPLSVMTSWLMMALFLIGLGWNLCYIAGSALLSESLSPNERGPVQGAGELIINLAAAGSSLGSGAILAAFGYGILGLIGAVLALAPLLVIGWQMMASASRVPLRAD